MGWTMRYRFAFHESLIIRLSLLFLLLGLAPTLLLVILPAALIMHKRIEPLAEAVVVLWGLQGVSFVLVILLGAGITLKRLALPIQNLVKASHALAAGDLSYRVPVEHGDDDIVTLSRTFNMMAESVETMRDGIEKQRADLQAALEERESEFETILGITGLINTQADLSSTAQRALTIARSILGTDMISLVLLDDTMQISSTVFACNTCLDGTPGPCDQCAQQQLLRRSIHRMQNNFVRMAIEGSRPVQAHVPSDPACELEPDVREVLAELKIGRFALKPLVTRGRVLGVLVLMRHSDSEVPERSVTLLETLAANIALLIENWHLQDKVRTLTILEERRRLASELHDSVTQSLFTLSLTARGLKSSLYNVPEANQQALDILIGQTKTVQQEMRTLINELRPIDLEADNLPAALEQHAQSLRRSTNIDVSLTIRGSVDTIPKLVQRNLNRIAQEALSNIARHAAAEHAEIILEVANAIATLRISDDGSGFDSRAVALRGADSLGLISMRERAEMLGGALVVRSQPGDETIIMAKIPLNAGGNS